MVKSESISGDALLNVLAALANPHRLRIIANLYEGSNYVSSMARDLGISRPLLHMHLQKLEAAGLVTGESSVADDGKARNYYRVTDFSIHMNPETIRLATRTLQGQAGVAATSATAARRNDV